MASRRSAEGLLITSLEERCRVALKKGHTGFDMSNSLRHSVVCKNGSRTVQILSGRPTTFGILGSARAWQIVGPNRAESDVTYTWMRVGNSLT